MYILGVGEPGDSHVISVFLIGHSGFLKHISEKIVSLVFFLVLQNLLKLHYQIVDLSDDSTAWKPSLQVRENDMTSLC